MKRLLRLDDWALLGLASSLTALWLGLWVRWSLVAWFAAPPPSPAWFGGLLLAAWASPALTRLSLGSRLFPPPPGDASIPAQRFTDRDPGGQALRPQARLLVALAGALVMFILVIAAVGPQLFVALGSGAGFLPLIARAVPPFLAVFYAWWHGQQLGRGPLGHPVISASFYTGLFALGPLLVLNGLLPALSSAALLAALLLFFGLGLSALALSSLRQLRPSPAARPAAFAVGRQWFLISTALIGLVLTAGLVAAQWLVPQALPRLAASLASLAASLAQALGQLLGPFITWLLALLAPGFPALSRFLERFITNLALALTRLQSLLALLIQVVSLGVPRFLSLGPLGAILASPVFQASARGAGLLVVLALAAVAFWLALRRLWAPASTPVDEQRDSILSGRLVLAQLRALLRRPARLAVASPAYLPLTGAPEDARLIIRRAYQGMLEWAQSLRLPRAAGQTPRAYAQMLAGAVPAGHEAIDLLTQAYMLARYAAEVPSLEQARRAEGAMARLKALHD